MEYLPEKLKTLENLFFRRNQRKIVIAGSPFEKVFDPWIKSYEAYSILRTSVILEIFKLVTYVHILNQNFIQKISFPKFSIFQVNIPLLNFYFFLQYFGNFMGGKCRNFVFFGFFRIWVWDQPMVCLKRFGWKPTLIFLHLYLKNHRYLY